MKKTILILSTIIGLMACKNENQEKTTVKITEEVTEQVDLVEIEPLLKQKSENNAKTTADKLEAILVEKGLKVFNRINHTDNASKVEMELRNTELILFGNPKLGTPLMQCGQTVAIDLPQKALVFENEKGEVWIAWNNPYYLKEKHQLNTCDEILQKIDNALKNIISQAAKN